MYKTLCDELTAEVDVLNLLRRDVLSLGQLKDILLSAISGQKTQQTLGKEMYSTTLGAPTTGKSRPLVFLYHQNMECTVKLVAWR